MNDKILETINDLLKTQGVDGNWNANDYMLGMYNGMELIIATIEDRGPIFREFPEDAGQ